MDLEQRQRLEADLWDEYVERPGPGQDLRVPAVAPERLEPKIRWALEFLGDIAGKRILDYGCGTARSSVYLAMRGAHVRGFDISNRSIEIAQQRAKFNGVEERTDFRVMGGEKMEYADGEFDIVFGQSILHHVVLDMAAREIDRVLKPGGKAVFIEPQGTNPLIRLVRAGIPYPGKKVHGTDRPLTGRDIKILRGVFPSVEWDSFTLFSGLEKMMGYRRAFPRLRSFDAALLRALPFLWWAYIYTVVRIQK